MTSIEAQKEWVEHLTGCQQCRDYKIGKLMTRDDGTGWARSWPPCAAGRDLHDRVDNLKDKEYKNRT